MERTMTSIRIRPRFQHFSRVDPDEVQCRIKARLQQPTAKCVGLVIPGFVSLKIPRNDRHFWSPQLSLSLEEHETGTLIRGLYGPNPAVWAVFAFSYAAVSILSLFVAIIGFSRLSLGLSAPILWLLLVLAATAVILYLFARVGQRIGAKQTVVLHHFFEEAIGDKVSIL